MHYYYFQVEMSVVVPEKINWRDLLDHLTNFAIITVQKFIFIF